MLIAGGGLCVGNDEPEVMRLINVLPQQSAATINDKLADQNKSEIKDATDDLKLLCELLNY